MAMATFLMWILHLVSFCYFSFVLFCIFLLIFVVLFFDYLLTFVYGF
jgi:hypothetical protein